MQKKSNMISSIEWIPAGVADPNPKKYELSSTEQELIQMMQEKGNLEELLDAETRETETAANNNSRKSNATKLPKVKSNTLPADLRMDEYSSDDDDDGVEGGAAIGRLLVGAPASFVGDMMDDDNDDAADDSEGQEAEEEEVVGQADGNDDNDNDKDSDDDNDSELDDVPDTREFEPVDVEGLEAMGMSHVGMSNAAFINGLGQDEDDDSEAEDVVITADDALVVVAKTEDVRAVSRPFARRLF